MFLLYFIYSMSVLTAFNNHLLEFLQDIANIFPEDRDIQRAKSALELLKKANPKAILTIWKTQITDVYDTKIKAGDISFFLDKDYENDLKQSKSSSKIMDAINRLREPIRNMGKENQKKTMVYIQNLTKLSSMYNY